MKVRGTGAKSFGEGVLNHLYEREQMVVAEGWSTAHALTQIKLRNLQDEGSVVRITILRHPIARIMSRYWFEGRWPLFTKDKSSETALQILVRRTMAAFHQGKVFRDRAGVWEVVHEGQVRHGQDRPPPVVLQPKLLVKTFAGWEGKPMCRDAQQGGFELGPCAATGVGSAQLEEAKRVLAEKFDLVLISEWLSSRAQAALLADALCFESDGAGGTPTRQLEGVPGARVREVPSFKASRPAGGATNERPKGWRPTAEEFRAVRQANALDLDLFQWAAETQRSKLASFLAARAPHPSDREATELWKGLVLASPGSPVLPSIIEL
eukprot:CAMPEP_0171805692 /NCGR_PEP_ID=MMETSP0991-20121206/74874_1 /TAXON_ID=483369 /ORGANISM="non described non described, Strain CCMP2098" /LENGTH=322 /DNA_ID=CAMNT_0012418337 /DNA_START=275 /DNA_END=1244 /DNA_ORIENTATION=+